jgi:hypothetical protein
MCRRVYSEAWDEYVKSLGFSGTPSLTWGDPTGFNVELFETERDHVLVSGVNKKFAAAFAASVNTPFYSYSVFVSNLPSLVRLIQELRPMLASEYEATTLERQGSEAWRGLS